MKRVSLLFFILPFILNSSVFNGSGYALNPDGTLKSEGSLSLTYSKFGWVDHYRVSLSPFNWLEGSFFYTDYNSGNYGIKRGYSYKDKGFSGKFLIYSDLSSDLAIGLEDFAGTGINSSEYIAYTRSNYSYDFTLGLAWGKLAGKGQFSNPLSILSSNLNDRDTGFKGAGGVLETGKWFRGKPSFFVATNFIVNAKRKLFGIAEFNNYTNNDFSNPIFKNSTNSNAVLGLSFRGIQDTNISLYASISGESGLSIKYTPNFSRSQKVTISELPIGKDYLELLARLRENGILLQSATIDNEKIKIKYINTISNNELAVADAIKDKLDEQNFEVISLTSQNGAYDNLEVLYSSGSRNILKQEDSTYNFNPRVPYPEFFYNYGIGNKNHIGSPAGFVFSEFNFQNSVAIKFNKNIEFQALHTYPLWDNYEGLGYNPGYTNLEPVRIEIQKYLREGQKGFEYFQMNYFENIGKNFFSLSFGDLEQMFGGINFQYLYRQPNSFFNFGFDISRVARREFNKSLFNYKKYHVTSAHLNMYFYEPKFEIQGKISYGRYLAKDRGFTFELARKLANGLKYGAFFSLTNLDQYQFGEGSFDKGVFVVIPLDIFEKKRKGYFTNTYRPLTRDGASKIVTNVDIYEATNFSSKYNFRK